MTVQWLVLIQYQHISYAETNTSCQYPINYHDSQ